MGKWTLLLGGLTVWAAHFFLLYALSSIFPGTNLARILTLVATVPVIGADALLLWGAAAHRLAGRPDKFDRWILNFGALEAALSLIAVIWQAVPAVIL